MKNLSLLISLIFISCASTAAPWKEETIAFEKQKWRLCIKEKDGKEKHLKGLCYISKECKMRFLIRKYCRPLPKFCPFTDAACLSRHAYSSKFLMRKRR